MARKKKLVFSDVLKKDLEVLGYLMIYGVSAWVSYKLSNSLELSMIFGAAINYASYRAKCELKGKGYSAIK